MSDFIFPNNTPIVLLDCEEALNLLGEKEKLYAHYLSRASWIGGLIILLQTSPESPLIYTLLHRLFQLQSITEVKQIALQECNFTEEEVTAFLVYTCGIAFCLGNYKSFGDKKFIPNLPKEKFEMLILASKFAQQNPEDVNSLLSKCLEPIYSLKENELQLGFPPKGTTTYLSKNFLEEEDNQIVNNFLQKKKLYAFNTRLFKTVDNTGNRSYEIRLASVLNTDAAEEKYLITEETMDSHKFTVARGDYSPLLKLVNKHLLLAKEYAANDNQKMMIEKYIDSFNTGSLDAHKDGSRFWVKDKGPIIETYIGFIETYRDPAGVRAEFEGFVAVVNKPLSEKLSVLVKSAEDFLALLPWPSTYELDKFLQPDYSSLDLLTFASGDVPIGINIPNYDEIKQSEGFKNVTLGNVICIRNKQPPNYLQRTDKELFLKYQIEALELQTALHELLGHGSGKLFKKNADGSFNFDINQVLHLETNEKITSWYEEGNTYYSVFGPMSSPYEECRAECVGFYLSTVPDILRIFGHEGDVAETVMYVNWLDLVCTGLEAVKFYEPKTESWLQAHVQAAYVILQVLLENEEPLVKIEKVTGDDGNPDLLLTVDRSKIVSVGKSCIGKFLKRLQLYKSTADVASAKAMFDKYSAVTSETKYPFLDYREIVIARRKPRKMIVQGNTFIEDGKVKLKNYETSFEGLIQSWIERYQNDSIDAVLEDLWSKDKHHFE